MRKKLAFHACATLFGRYNFHSTPKSEKKEDQHQNCKQLVLRPNGPPTFSFRISKLAKCYRINTMAQIRWNGWINFAGFEVCFSLKNDNCVTLLENQTPMSTGRVLVVAFNASILCKFIATDKDEMWRNRLDKPITEVKFYEMGANSVRGVTVNGLLSETDVYTQWIKRDTTQKNMQNERHFPYHTWSNNGAPPDDKIPNTNFSYFMRAPKNVLIFSFQVFLSIIFLESSEK